MRTDVNYYAILHVSPTASQRHIRRAFRRLALRLHPDVNQHPDATRQFQELNEAYRVLSDTETRAKYDRYAYEWGPEQAQRGGRAQHKAARRQVYDAQRRKRKPEPRSLWQVYAVQGRDSLAGIRARLVRQITTAWRWGAPSVMAFERTLQRWWAVTTVRYGALAVVGSMLVVTLLLWGTVLSAGAGARPGIAGLSAAQGAPAVSRINRIAFALFHDNQQDIFVGTVVGGEAGADISLMDVQQLTRSQSGEFANSPSWSANGKRIFYNSNSTHLYVMDSQGGQQTPVFAHSSLGPRVARNDVSFVFEARPDDAVGSNTEIFLASTRVPSLFRLTYEQGLDEHPSWSADGRSILFQSQRDDPSAAGEDTAVIYIMDTDGSNQRPIPNGPVYGMTPSWSPDGARIAYTSNRHDLKQCDNADCHSEIYVMNANGSHQVRLTYTQQGNNQDTAWSPDGEWIAFYSNRDGPWELYAIRRDGSQLTRLTTFNFGDLPGWSTRFWGIDWR